MREIHRQNFCILLLLLIAVTPLRADEIDEKSILSDIEDLSDSSTPIRRDAIQRLNRLTWGGMIQPTMLGEMSHLSEAGHKEHVALQRAFAKKIDALQDVARGRDDASATASLFCLAVLGPGAQDRLPFLWEQFKRPGIHPVRRLAIYCALLTNTDIDTSVLESAFPALSTLTTDEQLSFFRVLQRPGDSDFEAVFFDGKPLQSYTLPNDSMSLGELRKAISALNEGYSSQEVNRLLSLGRLDTELNGLSRLLSRGLSSLEKVIAIQMILPKDLDTGGERFASEIESLLADESPSVSLTSCYALTCSKFNKLTPKELARRIQGDLSTNERILTSQWLSRSAPSNEVAPAAVKDGEGDSLFEIDYLNQAIPFCLKVGNRGQKIASLRAAIRIAHRVSIGGQKRRTIVAKLTSAIEDEKNLAVQTEIRKLIDAIH